MRTPEEAVYNKPQLQIQVIKNSIFSIKQKSKVVIRPQDKGTRFAANSPLCGDCEKFFEKLCGRGFGVVFRIVMGFAG